MRPENAAMQAYLAEHGIKATPFFIWDGSMKGCWRIYCKRAGEYAPWTPEIWTRLNELGFANHQHESLGQYDGSGGIFQAFVRGHLEFLDGVTAPRGATYYRPQLRLAV